MLTLNVYNRQGDSVGTVQVDPEEFGGTVNKQLLHDVVLMHLANQRAGTHSTLRRGEVAGSTKKLFRQKGTGNARTGGIRNPIKKGGGHAKQKRPKDWRLAMPKKQRRLARDSALLAKIQSQEIRVIDQFNLEQPKTKVVAGMFKALGIERSCLLAIDGRNEVLHKSARNIDRTTVTSVEALNAWDLLRNQTLVVTRDGLEKILA